MQIIIIDTTGSISDEQLKAGTWFANELMSEMDNRMDIVCTAYCGNFDAQKVNSLALEDFTKNFRLAYPNCVIDLITDGFLIDTEIAAVDHIYVYENCLPIHNQWFDKIDFGDKLRGVVPVSIGD